MKDTKILQDLIKATTSGVLITPNSRIARHLQMQLLQSSPENSNLAVNIHSLSSWISSVFFNARDLGLLKSSPRVMSDSEASYIWKSIIISSGQAVNNISRTASLAYSAFKMCVEYGISISKEDFCFSEDCEIFYSWVVSFNQYLADENMAIQSSFPNLLLNSHISRGSTPKITMYGDIELTPLQTQLIKMICNSVEVIHAKSINSEPSLFVFDNPDSELSAAADWAITTAANNPDQSVCLVVTDLAKIKDKVIRSLMDADNTSHIRPMNGFSNASFNISLGRPFSDIPLISHTLKMVKFLLIGLPPSDLYQLVTSPYFPQLELYSNTFKFHLSASNIERLTPKNLNRHTKLVSDNLIATLESLSASISLEVGSHLPSYWAQCITSIFTTVLGWPGNRGLTTIEYQALSHWKSFIVDITKFDAVAGYINLRDFSKLLEHAASNTLFHEESNASNLNILGAVEAEGIPFDHLWLIGFDDSKWPSKSDRNPFIPKDLQLKYDLPHSSPDRELSFSRRLLDSYKSTSDQMILSYSKSDLDGRDRRLSPLTQSKCSTYLFSNNIQYPVDIPPIEITSNEEVPYANTSEIKGGAYLFKDFIKCPFLSFSNHRLGLLEPIQSSFGLNKAQQGTLLHEMMRLFWDECLTQINLIQLSAEDIENRLTLNFDQALGQLKAKYFITDSEAYFDVERLRLVDIASRWLQEEKGRPDFQVVATEKKVTRVLSGVKVNLVIDRIDLDIATKKLLFWDYKTGNVSVADLDIHAPTDPQLPLYVIDELNVSGLGYFKLSSKKIEAVGVANQSSVFSGLYSDKKSSRYGISSDWDANISIWKEKLENVSERIVAGEILNSPLKGSQTCRSCSKRWLCRVDEVGVSDIDPLHIFSNRYDSETSSGEIK